MAIPVINTTQSILALSVGQQFSFRFVASNSPNSWQIDPSAALPTGFSFNSSLGLLYGTGLNPGIWTLPMTARNSDGASTPVTFTIGIFQNSYPASVYRDIQINLDNRIVSLANPQPQISLVSDPTSLNPTNLFNIPASDGFEMYGDDVLWRVTFFSNGAPITPTVISGKMSLKGADDSDPFFITSTGGFTTSSQYVQGSYTTSFFLYFSLNSSQLYDYISQYETSSTTEANCLGEIELEILKPSSAPGPDVLKVTTHPFILRVRRDTVK